MFLNALTIQNKPLISAVLNMHSNRVLYPDTYVIDVDTFIENATIIKHKAEQLEIKLYGMTKQLGRNPYLARKLIDIGYEGIVAVDFQEALTLFEAGVKISHVGHLVQPPEAMIEPLVRKIQPEVITIYSYEKAKSLSVWCEKYQYTQNIMLKFYDENDRLYINQEAGFKIEDIEEVIKAISKLPYIKISGVTHFPCYLSNEDQVIPTHNLNSLIKAKDYLLEHEVDCTFVNAPSMTCCATLAISSRMGCTHCEPGHALTGTIPINTKGNQPEKVAILYLSEVSHHYHDHSYCFGGGYYRRGYLTQALVDGQLVNVSNDDASSIDYHLKLDGIHPVGTAAIMAFRSQIFTTRSRVALIEGLSQGSPVLKGVYTSTGTLIHG